MDLQKQSRLKKLTIIATFFFSTFLMPVYAVTKDDAQKTEVKVQEKSHKLIFSYGKSQISISGQINMLGFYASDSKFKRLYFGTNTASDNRFSINTRHEFSSDATVGSRIQLGLDTNPTFLISQTNPSTSSIDIRRAEIYFKMNKYGALLFGKGQTASDSTSEVDLSGTKALGTASAQYIGGGLYFNGVATNPQVRDAFDSLDGLFRRVRIRYDSPSLHGLLLSTSVSSGDSVNTAPYNDVALKFSNQIGQTKLAAQIAYTSPISISSGSNLAHGNEINGSASILFPVGISLTAAAGNVFAKSNNRDDPRFYYIKPAYQFHCFQSGQTAISIDHGEYRDFNQNKDKGTIEGAQASQSIDEINLLIYAGYRQFRLHRPGTSFKNINMAILGALYKF